MSIILLLSLLTLAFGRVEIANLHLPYVPDEYIITYYQNTTHEQAAQHWDFMDGKITFIHKYAAGFHTGFAAKITDDKVLAALQEDPLVEHIEANGFCEAIQQCGELDPEAGSWGLARISHPGDVSRGVQMRYQHHANSGRGVSVYVIDTGIMTTHNDFQNRARWGIAYADGGSQTDGNGHGTHCAGTVAGLKYGVAKHAEVVAVKVLGAGGGGTWADVVAGVNWVATNADPGFAVASMSLGGAGSNAALTNAINNLVTGVGIPCVVAAGNSNGNACSYTPSGIPSVISVGSSEICGFEPDEFDCRSSFSNYGTCTHLWAPGRDITSTWIGSNTATNTISGTSMACPHVAGYVAYMLSVDPSLRPDAIKSRLQSESQKDLIQNIGAGSPNFLLYNGCDNSL